VEIFRAFVDRIVYEKLPSQLTLRGKLLWLSEQIIQKCFGTNRVKRSGGVLLSFLCLHGCAPLTINGMGFALWKGVIEGG
jgi:hypothetical protein